MASEKILNLSADDFQEQVVGSDLPVLVDFWAPWCGPCLSVGPVLDALAGELDGKVKIAKVNVDENQQLAYQYGVSSIPAFVLFKEGQVADRMLGAMPKAAFQQFLGRNI